jgi:hypothetical protein
MRADLGGSFPQIKKTERFAADSTVTEWPECVIVIFRSAGQAQKVFLLWKEGMNYEEAVQKGSAALGDVCPAYGGTCTG